MEISPESKLSLSKQVHWKSVDGQAVVLHFSSGDYYALDPVGTFLWTRISEKPIRYADLLAELIQEYNCNIQEAEKDMRDFCGQLLAEKLLEIKDF